MFQKFGESLSPLQRALEDVNDQVAYLSTSDVYISPGNLRKVEDLNSRYVFFNARNKIFDGIPNEKLLNVVQSCVVRDLHESTFLMIEIPCTCPSFDVKSLELSYVSR